MSEYHLQRLAFRLKPGTLDCTLHNVRVPEVLKQTVLDMQTELKRRERTKTTVPSDNLNRAIRAIFPDLIAIGKSAWHIGQDYWLLADNSLPLPALAMMTSEWMNESYAKLSDSRRVEALAVLRENPLACHKQTVDLAAWGQKNGTAEYTGHKAIYNLLPSFIAARFSGTDAPLFVWGDFRKRFMRVPTGYDANGAELMSWPPEPYTSPLKDGGSVTDYFSVVITFTVQTIPFDPNPVLHCDVGVRRWVSRPLRTLEGGASVYVLSPVPWVQGGLTDSFTVAPLHRYLSGKMPDGKDDWKSSWGKNKVLMNLLRRMHLSQPFPSADEIFDDPAAYLKGKNGIYAAMTWKTDRNYESGGAHHNVGAGLPPLDRFKLWEWVCQVASPYLEPVSAQRSTSLPLFTPALKNPFFSGKETNNQISQLADEDVRSEEETAENDADEEFPRLSKARDVQRKRCELLKSAVGDAVEISLHFDSDAIRAGVESVLQDLFGVLPQTPHYTLSNGVTVHWNPVQKSGILYTPLFVGDDSKKPCGKGQIRQATEQRRDIIKATLPPATLPATTLVELGDKDTYFPRYTDPKTAIRKGLAHTMRLSQFLTPPPGNLPVDWLQNAKTPKPDAKGKPDKEKSAADALYSRVTNAVLDALRQLGVQMPILCRAKQAPLNKKDSLTYVHYVGYWLAKHTKGGSRTGIAANLPLFVKVDGVTGEVTARAMSIESKGARTWIPYRELLLRLGRDEYEPMMPWNSGDRFMRFTKETVEQNLFGLGDNYALFAHAQNGRRHGWSYLANTQLQQNRIGFDARTTADRADALTGLRVIRVRDSNASETPESFVTKTSETQVDSLAPAAGKGIYPMGTNTFYIRTKRPDTIRVSATISKLTAFSGREGGRVSPQTDETTPHVRLLEVCPFALQSGDDAFGWVALTLKLCEAATHFGGETTLPLPLHLAEKAEEYLHPLPGEEDEEEDEDDA